SEELYHLLQNHEDDLCVKQFDKIEQADEVILAEGELLKQVITALRDARNKNQIKPKEIIQLYVQTANTEAYKPIENILAKQVNTSIINYTNETVANTIVVAVEKDKFYIESEQKINAGALRTELLKDLEHQQKFLESVSKKLSNDRFVQNAKQEVVDLEKKKQADAEARIKVLEESLANL
ncbi:MAG: valine--tRNA ligase, partial [Segetibacter sp.]|nr:valine--tRNA ligase [Segetibacter sp.]